MKKIIKYFKACKTAFQAGMIAHRCITGCIVDDEMEMIIPCFLHEKKIATLAAENKANW